MSKKNENEEWRASVDTAQEITKLAKKKAKGQGVTFKPYTEDLRTRLAQVEEKRKKIIETPGSEKLLARIRDRGKLTARERIEFFFDDGTFVEHGIFAESQIKKMGMDKYYTPADGLIAGYGKVNGRMVCGYSTDYTVLAGAAGEGHQIKISDITQLAGDMKVPIVGIVDSAGVRLREASPGTAAYFRTFWLESILSGRIPQISIVLGGCAAGQVYSPNLKDFIIIDRSPGTNMWLGVPRATAAVTTAEDISGIGGADYHMKYTGSCHYAADDNKKAIEAAKKILSYCPSSFEDDPPYITPKDDPYRREERLLDILPKDPRRSYDMHDIIDLLVDDGEFFELMDGFAKNAIIGLARFNGFSTGIYAGNPAYISGCLDPDSCDKITRFVTYCDAFNIPLLYLIDTPAIVVGDEWERMGNARHGSKLLHTTMTTTVPTVGILVRKAYGGTLPVFLAKGKSADLVYVWPSGEYAPMGPDPAVAVIYDREIKELPTSEERLAFAEQKKKEFFDNYVDPLRLATNMQWDFFDDIIDPRRTREIIIRSFELAKNKASWKLPPKKHPNRPV